MKTYQTLYQRKAKASTLTFCPWTRTLHCQIPHPAWRRQVQAASNDYWRCCHLGTKPTISAYCGLLRSHSYGFLAILCTLLAMCYFVLASTCYSRGYYKSQPQDYSHCGCIGAAFSAPWHRKTDAPRLLQCLFAAVISAHQHGCSCFFTPPSLCQNLFLTHGQLPLGSRMSPYPLHPTLRRCDDASTQSSTRATLSAA